MAMIRVSRCVWLPALSMAFAACAVPPDAGRPTAAMDGVEAFVGTFLHAFEDLDLTRFLACFAEDATVFFPTPEPAQRFDGREAIGARFQAVFAAIRKEAPAGPPYHRLEAQDLQVRCPAPGAAVVTFHLRNAQRTARRTLVLRRDRGRWWIVHLHASNVAAT